MTKPASEGAALAAMFLQNADGFLRAPDLDEGGSEMTLTSACYGLELILKAYLLSRGRTDEWNRKNLGHDLRAAYREATFLGLPGDDATVERFLKIAAEAYAKHELFDLARARPGLLQEIDYLTAIRTLRRDAELRISP